VKFRYKAMQKMREPDELDSPTTLAAPRGWVAVMVVLIVAGAAVIWVFVGRLPVSVTATGLLTRPAGTGTVQSPWAGTVTSVPVRAAQQLGAGDVIARVQTPEGDTHDVTTHSAGKVIGVAVTEGDVITFGATIATVERLTGSDDQMVAMLFLPNSAATALRPGDTVDLSVATAPAAQYGLLRGTIQTISPYVLSPARVAALVGGDLPADKYTQSGLPRLVVVALSPDATTKSGYKWTTQTGPPFVPQTQVAVSATINLATQSPFDLMFGR